MFSVAFFFKGLLPGFDLDSVIVAVLMAVVMYFAWGLLEDWGWERHDRSRLDVMGS